MPEWWQLQKRAHFRLWLICIERSCQNAEICLSHSCYLRLQVNSTEKERELCLEVQVSLIFPGFIYVCLKAELAIEDFSSCSGLSLAEGSMLQDLFGTCTPVSPELLSPFAMVIWFPINCLTERKLLWSTKQGQQVPRKKGDVSPLPTHKEQSNNPGHYSDEKGKWPADSGQVSKLELFHQVSWVLS